MSLTLKVSDALVEQKMFPATDFHDGFVASRVDDVITKVKYSTPFHPIMSYVDHTDTAMLAYAHRLRRAGFQVERHGDFLLVSERPTED